MDAGIIAGAIAGGGLVVAIIIIVCVLFCRRYYKKEPKPDGMTTIRSAENEAKTISDGKLDMHNTSLNGPVATYYDERHRKAGTGRTKNGGLPGGNNKLQHSISFETIYPKESKLPAKGGVLRNSQRRKRSKNHSHSQDSSSDDSNSSFDQPSTARVSMDPRGKTGNKRVSNMSQVSNISSGDSYTLSPNTSTDGPGVTNAGYEANLSSVDDNSSFDTSHEGSEKRNVSFAPGVPVENYKGKPRRSQRRSKQKKAELAMKLAAKTPPPKYRQKKGSDSDTPGVHSGMVRRNSSRTRRRNSGRTSNPNSDSNRSSDSARLPPSPKLKSGAGHANPTFVPDSPSSANPPNTNSDSSFQQSPPQQSPPQASEKTDSSNMQMQALAQQGVADQQQMYNYTQQQYMDYQQYAGYMQQYYQDPQYAQQGVPPSETYQPMQYPDPNYYPQAYQQYYPGYDPNNPNYDPNNPAMAQNTNQAQTQGATQPNATSAAKNVPAKPQVQYETDPNQNVQDTKQNLNSSVETEV